MEFKQLILKNFLSYYGENVIDFADTTTVILGQNTSGKSKLFDSINWVLFERIYNTDTYAWLDKEEDLDEIQTLIPNKKCVREAIENKADEFEVSVQLVIQDGLNDIILYRSYYYYIEDGKPIFSSSGLSFREVNEIGQPVDDELNDFNAELKIAEKFPSEIRNFFLFQGEAASQILKLSKGSQFTKAVRKIARLENFETAKRVADSFFTTSRNIIKRNAVKNKELKEQQERIEENISREKSKVKDLEEKVAKADEARADYAALIQKDEDFLSTQTDFEDLFAKKNKLKIEQQRIIQEEKNLKETALEIADSWVFLKIEDKIKSFKNFYQELEKKGKVPSPIAQHVIKEALSACKCPICETGLEEGSPVRKIVEGKLCKADTDSLGSELRELNYCFSAVGHEIDNVPQNINNYHMNTLKISETRQSLKAKIKSLEDEIDEINITDSNQETKKLIEEARERKRNNERFLQTATGNYYAEKTRLDDTLKRIASLENSSLRTAASASDEIPEEDKIQLYYADLLAKAMANLAEKANEIAYGEIEKTANEYYQKMTKENPSYVGELKIDFKNSDIFTINANGQRITNINQANRISIQLAVIAGILSVANNQFGEQYPFITDAPISDLGGNNKLPTIKCMVNAFEQSILILKDDSTKETMATDEVRRLIHKDSEIGAAYELSIVTNKDVDLQYTKITKIKG